MMTAVKIVHFHPDARMAAQFVAPLMDAEQGVGYRTGLVSSVSRLGQEGIVIPFDLSPSNLLGLPGALWKIWRYLKKCRPDVVISHNTKSSLFPLLAAWCAGVHIRIYFNHGVPYVGYRGVLRWLLRTLELINSALATHVITVSQDMVALLQDISPNIKAEVILNGSASGIDLHTFSSELYSRTDWRKAHGLRDDDLVVVYVGRPERRKGFDLVLRLWADYLSGTAIKLILCGPEPGDVLKYLGRHPSNVISLGFVNNVPEVLSCSDLLILPSLHEGLSYASMEAQASGAVVVANDISGIRCVIEDGATGFLVADNAPEGYVKIIRAVDKDRTILAGIRRQARIAVKRFSRERFIPAYLGFLRTLLPR